ncbi:MAG TPA: sulfur transferase domain-containing protein [archaeon]|nr:sulfur transferase domain-containing protein [archaeon]
MKRGLWGLALTAYLMASNCVDCSNVYQVTDKVYRSAQLNSGKFGEVIKQNKIKTVINLRGYHPEREWYQTEVEACKGLGVQHHSIPFSSWEIERQDILDLLMLFDMSERPILIHCNSGTDRAAFASAVFRIYGDGDKPEDAIEELSLSRGHLSIGRKKVLRQIIERFGHEGNGRSFEEWVRQDY